MPPCNILLAAGFKSTGFRVSRSLATGKFETWPKFRGVVRPHGTSSVGERHGSESMIQPYPNITFRRGFHNTEPRPVSRPRYTNMRAVGAIGVRNLSSNMDDNKIHIDQAHFQKAYVDAWGLDRAKQRFKEKLSLPPGITQSLTEQKGGKLGTSSKVRKVFNSGQPKSSHKRRFWLRDRYVRISARRELSHTPRQIFRLDRFSSFWVSQFTMLSRKYDRRLHRYAVPLSLQIRRRTGTGNFERQLSHASILEIRQAWEALPEKELDQMWIQVMLGALERRPSWALRFLVATASSKPYPPSYAISDSIEYIVCFFLYNVEKADARSIRVLYRTVMRFLVEFDHNYLDLTQLTIFSLVAQINIDEAQQLYNTLIERNYRLHGNTLLQFAYKFARGGQTQMSIHAMETFQRKGGDFTLSKTESVCATLLQSKYRSISDTPTSDSEIFGRLLNLGLRPNAIFYNILLHNAINSGDSETAWKIHDMMPALGVEADAYTYSILLNAAKIRMDRSTMERITRIVESKGITNEFIITDLLHAMYLTYEMDKESSYGHVPPPSPLKRMLPLYAKHFDLQPLRELLSNSDRHLLVQPAGPKMHPSEATLTVMLIAILRGFTNSTSTPQWYARFRRLVLSGHPDIAPLAKSDHIYNAVIKSLGTWPVTLGLCTRVMSDMFSSYAAAQEAVIQSSSQVNNVEMLQTIMGSYINPIAAPISSPHSLHTGRTDDIVYQDLIQGVEGTSVLGLVKDAKSVNKDPYEGESGVSQAANFSPTRSGLVAVKPDFDRTIIYGHCKPTVQTWSILLKAFMDNNQPRAAEKVLAMMQSRGITPNRYTWNSLAIGYARLQDIPNTVDVIDRFENEGGEIDDAWVTGLQVIKDRGALIAGLRQKEARRLERDRRVRESVAEDLESKEPGSLRDVLYRDEQLFIHEDGAVAEARDAQRDSSGRRVGRIARPVRISNDDLSFLWEKGC